MSIDYSLDYKKYNRPLESGLRNNELLELVPSFSRCSFKHNSDKSRSCSSSSCCSSGSPVISLTNRRERSSSSICYADSIDNVGIVTPLSSAASIKSDSAFYYGKRVFEKVEKPCPTSFTPEMVIATPSAQVSLSDKKLYDCHEDEGDCLDSEFNFDFDFEIDFTLTESRESSLPPVIAESDSKPPGSTDSDPVCNIQIDLCQSSEETKARPTKFQNLGSKLRKMRLSPSKSDDNILAHSDICPITEIEDEFPEEPTTRNNDSNSIMSFRDPFYNANYTASSFNMTSTFSSDISPLERSREIEYAKIANTSSKQKFTTSVKKLAKKIHL